MARQASSVAVDHRLVPAFILRGFWDELQKRGVSVAELERASGVTRPRTGDFSSAISEQAMYALFEAARNLSADDAIGLTVGRAIGASGFHLVGHLALASTSLSQVIELIVQALPAVADRPPVLEDLGDGRVRFGFPRSTDCESPGAVVKTQLTAALLHDVAQHHLMPHTRELRVEVPLAEPTDRAAYDSAFPGGVSFDGEGTFVIFGSAALVRRRSGADPWLLEQFFRLAQDQYGSAVGSKTWSARVRRALLAHTAPRLVDVTVLAEQLGVSTRGLSRRLAREGVTVSELVDSVLFERARVLLSRPDATARATAETLGYAELSSFYRAFRRWSGGSTPLEYKRQHATKRV